MSYKLFTDGSYSHKDNLAGYGGYIINRSKTAVLEFSEQIKEPENFKWHERMALKRGLELALEKGIKNLKCYMDDKSLAEQAQQLNHVSSRIDFTNKVNKINFLKDISILKKCFTSISFEHIPREKNTRADILSRQSIKDIKHFMDLSHLQFSSPSHDIHHTLVFNMTEDIQVFHVKEDYDNNIISTTLVDILKNKGKELSSLVNVITETLQQFSHTDNISISSYHGIGKQLENIFKKDEPFINAKKELYILEKQLQQFSHISYYNSPKVMNSIRNTYPFLFFPTHKKDVLKAIESLSKDTYNLGDNLAIESHPLLLCKTNISDIQHFYFKQFTNIVLSHFDINFNNSEKKEILIENKIQEIKSDFIKKGIKLRF